MTKTDAEQHAAVWGLADRLIQTDMERAQRDKIELLTAALLAQSYLAKHMAQAYNVMAESIVE